jgi:hypothetical protein
MLKKEIRIIRSLKKSSIAMSIEKKIVYFAKFPNQELLNPIN